VKSLKELKAPSLRLTYYKFKATGRELFVGQARELDHPPGFDACTPCATVQLGCVALAQHLCEEDRVPCERARVELVAALMAKDDLYVFCLVHVDAMEVCCDGWWW
jgi:hypothetical protein